MILEVGWSLRELAVGACFERSRAERKVRASQGTMPDNVRAGKPDGKCHRNDTAGMQGVGCGVKAAPCTLFPGNGEMVR